MKLAWTQGPSTKVKHINSMDGFAAMYDSLYSNDACLQWW